MTALLFLHKLVEVFTEYFRQLEEESLRDNFVVVYELLDEMMDFGHPQTTEKNILKRYCWLYWSGLSNLMEIYNATKLPAGQGPSQATVGRFQCHLMAQRRSQIPQERSLS